MSRDTPLWKAHDVSQLLQDKLEDLPQVGRAFVHVDHETSHKPVRVFTTIYAETQLFAGTQWTVGFAPHTLRTT